LRLTLFENLPQPIKQFGNHRFLFLFAGDLQNAAIRFGLLNQIFVAGLNDVD